MTFRVMAGISAIWAGTVKELKDGMFAMTGKKYDVTEDVLAAAATWLADKGEWIMETTNGRWVILKVEIKEAEP